MGPPMMNRSGSLWAGRNGGRLTIGRRLCGRRMRKVKGVAVEGLKVFGLEGWASG
jgi:hypothetical protein